MTAFHAVTAAIAKTTAVAAALLISVALPDADAKERKKTRVAEKAVAAAGARLVGPDRPAAIAAASTLGAVSNRSASIALLDALALGLTPEVALAALAALEARGDAAAIPVLKYYSRVRAKSLRAAAIRAAVPIASARADEVVVAGLRDPTKEVRGIAAGGVAVRGLRVAAPTLLELLIRGEMPAAAALARLADAEIARAVAETIGRAPDVAVADSLGGMLLRQNFGPDSLRLEVVRALGKIPNGAGASHLAAYVAATPKNPPRASRAEAEKSLGDNL